MSDVDNVVAFPKNGLWQSRAIDNEPMSLAFVAHLFGFDKKRTKYIIEAVNSLIPIKSKFEENGDLILLAVGNNLREGEVIRSVVKLIDRVVLAANRSPCFVSCSAFNAAMAECVALVPCDGIHMTPDLQDKIKKWPANMKEMMDKISNNAIGSEATEQFILLMEKSAMSFDNTAPYQIQYRTSPCGEEKYVHMEWTLFNTEAIEDDQDDEDYYSYCVNPKYMMEDDETLEEMAESLENHAKLFRQMAMTGMVDVIEPVINGHGLLMTSDEKTAKLFGFDEDDYDEY